MDNLELARMNWVASLEVMGRLRQELAEAQSEERKRYLAYQDALEASREGAH